jgi:hypothetical protein
MKRKGKGRRRRREDRDAGQHRQEKVQEGRW